MGHSMINLGQPYRHCNSMAVSCSVTDFSGQPSLGSFNITTWFWFWTDIQTQPCQTGHDFAPVLSHGRTTGRTTVAQRLPKIGNSPRRLATLTAAAGQPGPTCPTEPDIGVGAAFNSLYCDGVAPRRQDQPLTNCRMQTPRQPALMPSRRY